MPIIYGENIMLREYRWEDFDSIRSWVNDREITQFLSSLFLFPHTKNKTESYLKMMLEGSSDARGFVIANKENGEYIGQIDLIEIDWVSRKGTLGIVIGRKDYLGKGIGTEAISLLLNFAFNEMNLNKIDLTLSDYNKRGIRCYEKCGFVEEGRLREDFYTGGKYTDTIMMGCLKKDFERIKKTGE